MEPTIEQFMAARDALCERIVQRRTEKFGRPVKGASFFDEEQMINADLGLEDAPPLVFHLIYRDSKGDYTGRGFKLMRLGDNSGRFTVGGVCYLRHAYRQFITGNIVELTDLATGEITDDSVAYFKNHPFLAGPYTRFKSPEEQALRAVRDELVVLSFVAASDGDIHDLEMEELVKFVARSWDDPLNEDALASRILSLVPDTAAFRRSMDRICAKPGKARPLTRALRAVVDADRRLDANELVFSQYIISRLDAVAQV